MCACPEWPACEADHVSVGVAWYDRCKSPPRCVSIHSLYRRWERCVRVCVSRWQLVADQWSRRRIAPGGCTLASDATRTHERVVSYGHQLGPSVLQPRWSVRVCRWRRWLGVHLERQHGQHRASVEEGTLGTSIVCWLECQWPSDCELRSYRQHCTVGLVRQHEDEEEECSVSETLSLSLCVFVLCT